MKKWIFTLFVILILLLFPLVSSQAVVEVPQDQEQKNFLTDAVGIFKNKAILSIILFLAILICILIGLFFFVRWVVQFIKQRSDIFFQLKKQRLKLASIQKRYPSTHWWKVEQNTPIRLVKKEGEKLVISSPIAHHRGDYITHEGNFILTLNLVKNKKWFFFPITDILIIPNRPSIRLKTRKTSTTSKKESETIDKLPQASDILQFNPDEILIFAESLSNTGIFYVPVLKSKDGTVIDLALPTYENLKRVVLTDYLYEQTDEFSKLAKKSMDINPNLRYATKVADTSGTVEVPSGTGGSGS